MEDPTTNTRKQLTGTIITLAAYLRNRKRILSLKIILYAMIISTGHTITSRLRSSVGTIKQPPPIIAW